MGLNAIPYEILMGCPFTLYEAPVGTAFPTVDEDPAAPWAKVGKNGNLNMSEDGLIAEHGETINEHRSAGDTGPRKASRTSESCKFRATINDLRAIEYARMLGGNTITTIPASAGVAGNKWVGLSRGADVATVTLLARADVSPEMADGTMQYEIPICYQSGSPTPTYKKGEAAGLQLEWTALVDPEAETPQERFGRLRVQTADAES